MEQTIAFYEHSALGFPGVVLKFSIQNSFTLNSDAYFIVKGIIVGQWTWGSPLDNSFQYALQKQLERFDSWVRMNYANDISIQG